LWSGDVLHEIMPCGDLGLLTQKWHSGFSVRIRHGTFFSTCASYGQDG
jgi:hypothetical protein